MKRMLLCAALLTLVTAPATAVMLGFPSEDSISGGPTGTGALGAGGGGVHFIAGDDLTETFTDTGLDFATSSRWQFEMDDWTDVGVVNTFDIEINGTVVGDFSFTGVGVFSTIVPFDLTFTHPPIIGDDYTLRMVATSTVPPGLASWNWLPGGTVTLLPEPATLVLLGLGGLLLRRQRRE